jgi:hypothetical protein
MLKVLVMLNEGDVNAMMPALDKLLEGKKKRNVLVDLTLNPPGLLDKPARKAFAQYAEAIPFDKIAMYGAKPVIRMIAKVAVAALGRSKVTKFFDTREQAVSWLNASK